MRHAHRKRFEVTLCCEWLMDHCEANRRRKDLPGEWFREHEFAGRRARLDSPNGLQFLSFPCWHGLCKETGEPPAWESRRLKDDGAAWEGRSDVGQGEQDRWRTPS